MTFMGCTVAEAAGGWGMRGQEGVVGSRRWVTTDGGGGVSLATPGEQWARYRATHPWSPGEPVDQRYVPSGSSRRPGLATLT